MLNYSKAIWAGNAGRNQGRRGPILLDHLRCSGNERSIEQCNHNGWGAEFCNHNEDAGIICQNLPKEEIFVEVRLAGALPFYGTVEVNYKWTWIPVCDDNWDILDAHVTCRMLGYKAALAGIKRYEMSQMEGKWMGGVECNGEEVTISECYHRGWSNSQCYELFNAAVLCQHSNDSSPVEFRLEEGSSPISGRVAVRYGNVWGTICNKGLDINDAKVICRMLGYPGASKVYPTYTFRPGNGTIWLSNLECNGTENSVVNCSHPGWGQTTCNHDNDAAISCTTVNVPTFHVNDFKITESSAALVIEASNAIETVLDSAHQIVCERLVHKDIFHSLDQKQIRLPCMIQDVTMATRKSSPVYISAEIPYSPALVNFTVGDGLYYNGYYNAPLEPGCAYKVYLRIVTKTSTGEKVFGDSAFVAFTTKAKKESKFFQAPGSVVIVLSIVIMVLITLIAGYFVRMRRRTKNGSSQPIKKNKRKTPNGQNIEMTSPANESTIGNYQSLHRGSQEDLEESLYVNVSVPKPFHLSAATTTMATSNLYSSERSVYENVVH